MLEASKMKTRHSVMNAGSNFNVKTEKPENAITELITIVII